MFNQLFNTPTIDLLQRTINFTEQRNRVLANDIANIDTPGFIQQDVSVGQFQKSLARAVERSREGQQGVTPESASTVSFSRTGNGVTLHPHDVLDNTAFHDRGVRSLASLMSNLAQNAEAHQEAARLLTAQFVRLRSAISLTP